MKRVISMMVVLLAFVFITACSNGGSSSSSTTESTTNNGGDAVEVGAEEQVVNIGYSGPLSGPGAFYGEYILNGVKMAADEINENGIEINGQTYKINLIPYDDMYLPNETGTNARRLVQEHDTPIIFASHSGGVFATQVFNEQEGFLIAAYTSEPKIVEQGNKLTLQISPRYDQYPEVFSKYQMERFGNKLAVLPTATQYGKDWTETLVPVWEGLGGEVVFDGSIDFSKDTDFFTIVTNALSEKPDVLFLGGPSEPTALVIKQARELGFEGGFMIMDQAKVEEMEMVLGGYELLEGAIGVLPVIDSDAPGAEAFTKKYEESFGRIPTAEAALPYQTLLVLAEAMSLAGTATDAEAIFAEVDAAIKSLPEEKFIWHLTGLDNQGMDWRGSIGAIENGEIVVIE